MPKKRRNKKISNLPHLLIAVGGVGAGRRGATAQGGYEDRPQMTDVSGGLPTTHNSKIPWPSTASRSVSRRVSGKIGFDAAETLRGALGAAVRTIVDHKKKLH